MQLNINAIQTATTIPEYMTMHELQQAMSQDQHLQCLNDYIIQGWPESRDQIPQDIRTYWTFRDDMAVIDEAIIKGKMYGSARSITKTGTPIVIYQSGGH